MEAAQEACYCVLALRVPRKEASSSSKDWNVYPKTVGSKDEVKACSISASSISHHDCPVLRQKNSVLQIAPIGDVYPLIHWSIGA